MMQRGSGIYTNSWSQWFREDYHGIWLLDVVLMRFLISFKELPLRYRERDYGKQFLLIYGNNYGLFFQNNAILDSGKRIACHSG